MRPSNTNKTSEHYIPALRYDWLTALYDPVIRLTTRERTFKERLIRQADIRNDAEVLDLGCGTGTLAIWVKKLYPQARVTGLDGDLKILSIAQRKAQVSGMDIQFDHGMSFDLPYPDASFDRVLSSLFFHHLTRHNKERTLREILRVLKPKGELHIADWGKASNPIMRALFYSVQVLDGFETTEDNVRGLLPELIENSGFSGVSRRGEIATIFGTLALYSAVSPS